MKQIIKKNLRVLGVLSIFAFLFVQQLNAVNSSIDYVRTPLAEVIRSPLLPSVVGRINFTGKSQKEDGLQFVTGTLVASNGAQGISFLGLHLDQAKLRYSSKQQIVLIQGFLEVYNRAAIVKIQIRLSDASNIKMTAQFIDEIVEWDLSHFNETLNATLTSSDTSDHIKMSNVRLVPILVEEDLSLVDNLKKFLQKPFSNSGELEAIFFSQVEPKIGLFAVGTVQLFNGEQNIVLGYDVSTGSEDFLVLQARSPLPLRSALPRLFFQPQVSGTFEKILKLADEVSGMSQKTFELFGRGISSFVGNILWDRNQSVISTVNDERRGLQKGVAFISEKDVIPDALNNSLLQYFAEGQHFLKVHQNSPGGIVLSGKFFISPDDSSAAQIILTIDTHPLSISLPIKAIDGVVRVQEIPPLKLEMRFRPVDFLTTMYAQVFFADVATARLQYVADKAGITLSGSGIGGIDFAKGLQNILGDPVYKSFGGGFSVSDWNIEIGYTWAVPDVLRVLWNPLFWSPFAVLLAMPRVLGIGAEVQIGSAFNPLHGTCRLRGGTDMSQLLFEIYYGQRTGHVALALFIAEFLLRTVLNRETIDLSPVQSFFERILPISLDGYYLRAVPNSTTMGGISVPFGYAGNVQLHSFGKEIGADLIVNEKGLKALAFIEPFSWGPFHVYPPRRDSSVMNLLKAEFDSLKASGIIPANKMEETTERVAVQLVADKKSIGVGSNVGISFGGIFNGTMAAIVNEKQFAMQGNLKLGIPGFMRELGMPEGGFELQIKGHSKDASVDPFSLLQYDMDPSKLLLEVEFSDTLTRAIQKILQDTITEGSTQFSTFMQNVTNDFFKQTQEAELQRLRSERDRICGDTGFMGIAKNVVGCAAAKTQVALAESKNFVLDKIPQLGEAARAGMQLLTNAGITIAEGGRVVIGSLANMLVIKRIWWQGTLAEFSQGILRDITLEGTVLGRPVRFTGITLNLFRPIADTITFVSKFPGRIFNNISHLPGFGFLAKEEYQKQVQQIEEDARKAAEERYRKWLEEEAKKAEKRQQPDPSQPTQKEQDVVDEDWDWFDKQWD